MLRILDSDTFDPFTMVSIRMPGCVEPTIQITDAGQSITFGGDTYSPCPFSVSELRNVLDTEGGEQPSITIGIQNVDRQFASLLNRYEFDGSEVYVYRWDRRLYYSSGTPNERDVIQVYRGELRNAVLSDHVLQFEVLNVMAILEQQTIPRRVFQSGCNVGFGTPACGANAKESPNRISTTVQAGSDRRRLLLDPSVLSTAGSPSDPTKFWKNGYVLISGGTTAVGQSRSIQEVKEIGGDSWIYLRDPYLEDPEVGATVIIQRSCPRDKEGCAERQGHVLNYQGFEEMTSLRPVTLVAHAQ
jgi:hypothetical protein